MKTANFSTKLNLGKETISTLNMAAIKGGEKNTIILIDLSGSPVCPGGIFYTKGSKI